MQSGRRGAQWLAFPFLWQTFILKTAHFKRSKSRPLWYTINHSPVFILGGIEDEKTILLSDTSFQDYSLVEVSDARQTVGLGFWTKSGATEWDPKDMPVSSNRV